MRCFRRSSIFVLILSFASCGATLPKEVLNRRPVGVETPLNLELVTLSNLKDGSPVTIGPYMRERNLQWMVLTFGSKSCGACMEKARYFQANLVGDYGVLGESAKGNIELRGIATDPASSRDELLALVEDQNLSHLSWSDSGDEKIMMKYFQPAGMSFSVPLTVMISREGILWRITSKEKVSPAEILKKIAATIGSNALPSPIPSPPTDHTDPDAIPLLAREVPERLSQINVKSCLDRRDVNLGRELPPLIGGLRGVFIHKGNCSESAACLEAREEMKSWQTSCKTRWGASCSFRELNLSGAICGDEEAFSGGAEIFDVFVDHFSWAYRPMDAGPGRIKLPDPKGPWTLIFDDAGRLVYSKDGVIAKSLAQRMDQDRLTKLATGPEFPLEWNSEPGSRIGDAGVTTFSEMRMRAKYTMMMFWNTWCSSCTEELQEWHLEEASGYGFCRAHPEFCQVVALETGRAESGVASREYLAGLIRGNDDFDGWVARGWSMPLAVEAEPYADGRAAMGWYAGWVRARFGSSEPRTVLYDREGKVVGVWRSLPGEHGPRDMLKKLYETGL